MSEGAETGAVLSVTQTITLFTVLMPPVADINRASGDGSHPFTSDVRQAELVAGGLSLAVGLVMARIEGSWVPFVAAATLVTLLVVAYEYTLRKPAPVAGIFTLNTQQEGSR